MIEAGANINLVNQSDTYLIGTIRTVTDAQLAHNTRKFIRLLIDSGADINARSESLGKNGGATALMSAAESGDIQIVRMLLEAGADPLLKDNKGLTALDYAKDSYYIKKSGDKELIPLLESLQIPSERET